MNLLLVLSLLTSFSVFADEPLGPIAHERKDTPKKKNAHVGRYFYVGNAPKFKGQELELTVSKLALTLRVTAWVDQAMEEKYAEQLYKRWLKIDTALQDHKLLIHPSVRLEDLVQKKSSATEAWIKIANQYSSHVLDKQKDSIYFPARSSKNLETSGSGADYRRLVSQAVLRYYFDSPELTPDLIKSDNFLRDRLLSAQNSKRLFRQNFNHIHTSSAQKPGYGGYLTFVYPIAATTKGPFDQPKERVTRLLPYGSMESRWWSDKNDNDDLFAGLPFILFTEDGIAFHGPISNFEALDVWFLRRGYVSHGCHRMDSSDVMEFRTLLPRSLKDAGKVKLTIYNHFDVVDWNLDGVREVVDVKYYEVPTYLEVPKKKTVDDVVKTYLVENQMKRYFVDNKFSRKFYDKVTDKIVKAPKYVVGKKGVLSTDGVYEPLPIYRFDVRPNRIFHYDEEGVKLRDYDDVGGTYPPSYFQEF